MPRLLLSAAPALLGAMIGLGALATPAFAQDTGGEKINQLIVYGKDPCPRGNGNEITVCARKPEEERYRIPEPLRGIDSPKSEAWTNKVAAYETVGNTGILSCSPVGPGGGLGCTQQLIDRAYSEKKNGSDVRFSELIDKERQKRLATIDADAAEQQARVEDAEKAYFEQQKRQAAEADAAEAAGTTTTPKSK